MASKRRHNYKSVVKLYLQYCCRTVQPKYSDVFSTYEKLIPESDGVIALAIKKTIPTLQA